MLRLALPEIFWPIFSGAKSYWLLEMFLNALGPSDYFLFNLPPLGSFSPFRCLYFLNNLKLAGYLLIVLQLSGHLSGQLRLSRDSGVSSISPEPAWAHFFMRLLFFNHHFLWASSVFLLALFEHLVVFLVAFLLDLDSPERVLKTARSIILAW